MAGNVHTVGAIRIAILSKTAEFTRGLRSTLTGMDKMRSKARRVSRAIQRHWRSATAAVAGLTAALGFGIKRMTDYSSKLVEMARAAGMTTSQLEDIRALLQGDGIGIARTDKAMQEFTVRLGFAQRGIGQYTRSFEEMGVAVQNQDGTLRSQTEVLSEVAEAIQKTSSHSTAASFAYELFGRSGKELLPILQKYGDKLGEAAEHAGRFRTLTDEQHLTNKDLGQSIFELTENTSDLVQRGLALAAPHLRDIVDDFNDWIAAIKKDEGTMEGLKSFAEGLGKAFAFVAKTIAVVITGFGYMFKAVKTVTEHVADLFTESFDEAREKFVQAGQALEDHRARGPLTLPSGRVSTASQMVFDETTNRLEAEVARTRSVYDIKQAEVRAKQHGRTLDELVRKLVDPIETAIEKGAEKGMKKAVESTGAKQFTREGQLRAKAESDALRYAEDAKNKVITALFEGVFGVIDAGEMRLTGGRRNEGLRNRRERDLLRQIERARQEVEDSRRMRYSYHSEMFAGIMRHPIYDPNAGIARIPHAREIRSVGNIGGASAGAIGGFPWLGGRGSGRDPAVEEAEIYALARATKAWNESLRDLATTFETRIAGASASWKGRLAEIHGVHEENKKVRAYDPNAGIARIPHAREIRSVGNVGGASAGAIGGFPWLGGRGSGRDPAVEEAEIYALARATKAWNESLRDLATTFETRSAGAAAWWKGGLADEVTEEVDRLTPMLNDARGAFGSFANSIVDGFENAGEAARNFAKDLVRIGIQRLIVNPAADALFGTSDGSEAGFFGRLFKRADGGHTPRGMALVGERGPELVDFSRPGMVYTNEQLTAAMSGGRSVNVVYNISSTDGPGVRAALAEATPGIVGAAQASVAEGATRPGAFRRAVRGR